MKVFVDTSAFYALIAEEDRAHETACQIHEHLKQTADALVTSNYVILETVSLLQRRHGVGAAEQFGDAMIERVEVVWVEADSHRTAWRLWKERRTRGLSLVDCSSFSVMRMLNLRHVFAFDRQFTAAGFLVLGGQADQVADRRGAYRAKAHKKAHAKTD